MPDRLKENRRYSKMKRDTLKSHLNPALFISVFALFVALGGSAVAYSVGKNSVGAAQLKDGSVITSKIRNGAVSKSKLANSVKDTIGQRGPQGEQGPRGFQGERGEQGLQGIQGVPGLINWSGVYEVTATRTGSGTVTASCSGNDQVLFGTASANSAFSLGQASRQNGGRDWFIEIGSSPGVVGKAIAYCVPN